ncbi:hypothetical protein G7Y79_00013g034940 [Physcia stellaris]|nr:hypothetical protein G7Y79_00013g034940 [Physcia stellaris]
MAPSSGHMLVPKVLRIMRFAVDKTSSIIRSKFSQPSANSTSNAILQPIRISTQSHPLHPLARIRQSRHSNHRWFSTTVRNLGERASRAKVYDRSSFGITNVGKVIRQRGGAPFASSLRPNLTGGALPRTAGGYSLGGTGRGIRHFSQTPTCQAQVIHNVNAGIRAFFVGGGKARFDGVDPTTGEKRFRRVTNTEDEVLNKFEKHVSGASKGTSLEFRLSPTITALFPSTSQTLGSVDGPILSVRFAGCDAETVARLCEELGVFRGIVREDESWDHDKDVEMALLFPFAPTSQSGSEYFEHRAAVDTVIAPEQVEWQAMMSPSAGIDTPGSTLSYEDVGHPIMTPAYDSASHSGYSHSHHHQGARNPSSGIGGQQQSHDFEGLEGIYRFLQECDDAHGRVR